MEWRPDFELGIAEIDQQHRKIVELINTLTEAYNMGESTNKLEVVFDEITYCANDHFKMEEKLFMDRNFPFAKEHILQHEHFSHKMHDYKMRFESGQSIASKVPEFLKRWWTDHILDSDREYVDLVKNKI
jgi:hemerythrin